VAFGSTLPFSATLAGATLPPFGALSSFFGSDLITGSSAALALFLACHF